MTTPPLDLEAMAEKLIAVITNNELTEIPYPWWRNVRSFNEHPRGRGIKQAILSALREVAEQKDKEIASDFAYQARRYEQQLNRLTELVEKWNQWADHMPSCSKYVYECGNGPESGCTCGLEQLLNEATKKEV